MKLITEFAEKISEKQKIREYNLGMREHTLLCLVNNDIVSGKTIENDNFRNWRNVNETNS